MRIVVGHAFEWLFETYFDSPSNYQACNSFLGFLLSGARNLWNTHHTRPRVREIFVNLLKTPIFLRINWLSCALWFQYVFEMFLKPTIFMPLVLQHHRHQARLDLKRTGVSFKDSVRKMKQTWDLFYLLSDWAINHLDWVIAFSQLHCNVCKLKAQAAAGNDKHNFDRQYHVYCNLIFHIWMSY